MTGGTYQRVTTARDLSRVYTHLGRVIGWEQRPTEISGLTSVGVAVLFVGTVVISLLWTHRLG